MIERIKIGTCESARVAFVTLVTFTLFMGKSANVVPSERCNQWMLSELDFAHKT